MSERTFEPMSASDALAEMAEMGALPCVSNMPVIEDHHPAMMSPEGLLVCVHDTANDRSLKVMLPPSFIDPARQETPQEFQQRTRAHLDRIVKAVFN